MANSLTVQQRRTPWIGIGVSGSWSSSIEALHASELDFAVRQEELFWQNDDEGIVYNEPVPMYANVRNTDDSLLGCVTPQYKIVQNHDAFALIDPFLGSSGRITHAGMTGDGLCFMVAEVNTCSISGEDYTVYLMVTNSFNTKYPCQVIMTPVRIICQNMYRKLIDDRVFSARHTLTANDRLVEISNGKMIDKKVSLFTSAVEQLQSKSMDKDKLDMLVSMLFPYPKEGGPRESTFKMKADEQRKMFVDQYWDANDNREHHGSAFGFVNAYFDYLSHRDSTRSSNVPWEDRRLSGIVSGNDIMMPVLKAAMK